MNRKEIGKMISLADDSYVEEMFTTRLYERKHHGAAWIAAAAAVAIAVGAAGIALNSSDSDKIITDIQEILTETETDTSALESVVTTQEWSYRTNNRGYFKNKPDDTAEFYYSLLEHHIGFTSEGPEYRFTSEYLDGILRFDRKDFLNIEGGLQCGKNGVPLYAEIRLFNDDTENLPMVHMVFYKENSPFADFDKSLYTPDVYGDTTIYGFDLSEKKDGSKLMACWRYGDTNYMFTSRGLDFDKFIDVISPYIEFYSMGELNLMYRDYFTLDSFDLSSKGVVKSASYDKGTSEMNRSSVFAGYVPDYTPLAGLHYAESSDNYKEVSINGEVIHRLYNISYYEYGSYDGKEKSDIYLTYEWGENPLSDRTNDYPVIPLDEITPEKLDEIMIGGGEREHHSFVIPVKDFTITVMAVSEHGQLYEVIDVIRSGGKNVTVIDGTAIDFTDPAAIQELLRNSDEINSQTVNVNTEPMGSDDDMIIFDGRVYYRSMLSEETLEWLDWYNSASKEEQDSVSYVPSELLTFLEYWF